jgi:thiol-disulfide isomerase/thioredoxin
MRRMGTVLAMGMLVMGLASSAAAQSVASAGASSATAQRENDASQRAQPMSLGDLARQVRVQKQGGSKATKVIDDENLPRNGQGISIVGSGGGSDATAGGRSFHTGRMTLLDFWASWCGPCRESVPDLKALQGVYGSDQLEVISVDEDKNADAGRSYASEHGMNWEVQFDSSGATARQHNVKAYPTFILVDGNGQEVRRFVGVDSSQPLASRIGPYLEHGRKTSL